MTSEDRHPRELATLLEKWCEERLSAQETVRLEQLVMSDPRAMREYLHYVHLHGTLHWDTAVTDGPAARHAIPEEGGWLRPISESIPHPRRTKTPPTSWWRRSVAIATVCASLALIVSAGVWLASPVGPQAVPVADQSSEPGHAEDPIGGSDKLERLAPPETAQPSIPLVDLGRQDENPEPVTPTLPESDADPRTEIAVADDPVADEIGIVAFIDQQLSAGWTLADVSPSPVAGDGEWLRRASLDLTGRIPTLDALEGFLGDESVNNRAELVERMLASNAFADHLTTVWSNHLVGRSEQKTEERRGLVQFLTGQFRDNRPWDETVAELIAAEGSVRENGASGFLLAHLNDQAVPATAITARLFLGQQVQCTQCHKHPWNIWSQEQFWNLNAFFQQARIVERTVADPATGESYREPVLENRSVGGPTYYENRRGVMLATYPVFAGQPIDPGPATDRRRELAGLLSSGDDTQLSRAFVNRTWAHFFGYGFTNPVDDMGPHHPPSHPELLERLSREFIASGYDVRKLIGWITSCRAYHLSSRKDEGNAVDDPAAGNAPLFSRMTVKSLTPEQVFDSLQIATLSESRGEADADRRAQREEWVQQFFDVLEDEENGEVSTFGGSITQALTMMNGALLSDALTGEPGTVLERILTTRANDIERIRQLSRAALSREPTPAELSRFRRIVNQAKSARDADPRASVNGVLRDIYWAYLNSSEFVTNR